MPLPHEHPENDLPEYRVRIHQKGFPGRNRIIKVSAHNDQEARVIVEGQYPGFEIDWVE